MREYQEKKRYKKFLYSKTAVVILIILLILLIKATWGVYKKQEESAANAVQASHELEKLSQRQEVLNSELKRLQTDAGIEEEIRSKYSVSKPGEDLLIVVDGDKDKPMPEHPKESWWNKFKKFFK
jgi:cell division protein FtsB